MIEIIKKGKIRYQWTCNHCKCVFEADDEDEQYKPVYDNQGVVWAEEYTIKCPTCQEELSSHFAPKSTRVKL